MSLYPTTQYWASRPGQIDGSCQLIFYTQKPQCFACSCRPTLISVNVSCYDAYNAVLWIQPLQNITNGIFSGPV